MADGKYSLSSLIEETEEVTLIETRKRSRLNSDADEGGAKKVFVDPSDMEPCLGDESNVNVIFVDNMLAVEGISDSISEEQFTNEDTITQPLKAAALPLNSPHFEYPDEINGCPVFTYNEKSVTLQEMLEIAISSKFDKRYICDHPPTDITQTCSFIIDLHKVEHRDIIAADNKQFGRHSSPVRFLSVKIRSDGSVEDFKPIKNSADAELPPAPGYVNYRLKRQYSWHKYIQGFTRIVTRVEENGVSFRYGMVHYKVPSGGAQSPAQEKPARTRRSNEYAKPSPSRDNLKPASTSRESSSVDESMDEGLKDDLDTASGAGTVTSTEPHSSTSHNNADSAKTDIYNLLKSVNTDKPKTVVKPLADYSHLLSFLQGDAFLRDVSFSSFVTNGDRALNVRTFAMGEVQEHWLKTFCSGENPKSCASIRLSHRLGDHYVITMTCPLPMFVHHNDINNHPAVLLAFMTSLTHEKNDYDYFASNLRRFGVTSMVYGTDGDEVSRSALEGSFSPATNSGTIHLCCFDKAKSLLHSKFEEFKIGKHLSDVIITRIFGDTESGESSCLVNQENEPKFSAMLNLSQSSWPAAFRTWLHSSENGSRCFADTLKQCMLKPLRVRAGLGDPPRGYSNKHTVTLLNNAVEELNSLRSGSLDLVKVHEVVKSKVIEGQVAEFVKAMYNMGELRLSQGYKHLCVPLLSL